MAEKEGIMLGELMEALAKVEDHDANIEKIKVLEK
jgi:hypothetical protein